MNIQSLETFEEQFRLFDSLDREEGTYLLRDALEEQGEIRRLFRDLRDAWMSRDLETLESLTLEAEEENPEFYEVFITLEMKDMPAWLESLGDGEREAEFREYVTAFLGRYGDDVEFIQFGNEWNWEIDRYFNGDDAEFIRFANLLYAQVMELSPPPESVGAHPGHRTAGAAVA